MNEQDLHREQFLLRRLQRDSSISCCAAHPAKNYSFVAGGGTAAGLSSAAAFSNSLIAEAATS